MTEDVNVPFDEKRFYAPASIFIARADKIPPVPLGAPVMPVGALYVDRRTDVNGQPFAFVPVFTDPDLAARYIEYREPHVRLVPIGPVIRALIRPTFVALQQAGVANVSYDPEKVRVLTVPIAAVIAGR